MPTSSAHARPWPVRLLAGVISVLFCLALVPSLNAEAAEPATITVHIGGDRTGVETTSGLSGVQLGVFQGQTGTAPLATCTSVGTTCVFSLDADGLSFEQRGNLWVGQVGAPSGYFQNSTLGVGGTIAPQAYRFQLPRVAAGGSYDSLTSFMASGNNSPSASSGIWATSRNNPALPQKCGLNVALVLDVSGSVSEYKSSLQDAAKTITGGLAGTPSNIALFSFNASAPGSGYPNLGLTNVAGGVPSSVTGWINGLPNPTGSTNWDRGLAQVAETSSAYDLTVFITDGSPTSYNSPAKGPGNLTRFREVEEAIFSANKLKTKAATVAGRTNRIVAVGVGSGVTSSAAALNLSAISGTTAYNGSNGTTADYFQEASYDAAANAIKSLALGNCTGTVSVVKKVLPSDSIDPTTATNGGADWQFSASATNGVTPTPASGVTNSTGAMNFDLSFNGATTTNATIVETPKTTADGTYTFVPSLTACTNLSTQSSIPSTPTVNGFTVAVTQDAPISCTVYNQLPKEKHQITIEKRWNIWQQNTDSGGNSTYQQLSPDGGWSPDELAVNGITGLTAQGRVNAEALPWGDGSATAVVDGTTVSIGEVRSIDSNRVCKFGDPQDRGGTQADLTVTADAGPAPGKLTGNPLSATVSPETDTTYTIHNSVICETKLSLGKVVQGGTANPNAWTLTAHAPDGALPGPIGNQSETGGSTAYVTAPVTGQALYQLSESGGDPLYAQLDHRTDADKANYPQATGSWTCVGLDPDGSPIGGNAGGINGTVTIPFGGWVRCLATNQTAMLTLLKTVENTHGGTAQASDWDLTAAPTPAADGLKSVTVTGAEELNGDNSFGVRPGTSYTLTEQRTGTQGDYEQTGLQCRPIDAEDSDWTTIADATITVSALDHILCRFTNTQQDPYAVKIDKRWVVYDNGQQVKPEGSAPDGSIATADLATVGLQDTIEATGSINDVALPWGDGSITAVRRGDSVTITEEATVTDASSTCRISADPTMTDSSGTAQQLGEAITPSGDTTYTIVNRVDCSTSLTLLKSVENGYGGTAVPGDWTLSATPSDENAAGQSVTGSSTPGKDNTLSVQPGLAYTLSESGSVDGYEQTGLSCRASGDRLAAWQPQSDPLIVGIGQSVTCQFVNTQVKPATPLPPGPSPSPSAIAGGPSRLGAGSLAKTGLTTAAAIAALALIAAGATGLVLRRRRSDNSR